MLGILKKMLGDKSTRDLKVIKPLLDKTLAAYEDIKKLDNDALRAKTNEFKQLIAEHISAETSEIAALHQQANDSPDMESAEKEKLYNQIDRLEKLQYDKTEELLTEILPEAFSVMKETARRFKENETIEVTATEMDKQMAATRDHVEIRGDKAVYKNSWVAGGNVITWDMVHYDVQLIGGIVLHEGKIAEMATGEGKTLVATLPVYLNALAGKGVHLVTVNDYLAKRDSEWMGVIYEFLGLTIDCIDKHQPNSTERRKAYLADITYGTNNEFGFDYLRDNMTGNPDELVQRKHHYTIVDEVDSVLIDDARTPLIISGPTPRGDHQEFDALKPDVVKLFNAQKTLVSSLLAESKKILQSGAKDADMKRGGDLLFRAYRGLPKNHALIKFLSEEGMRSLMQKTESFYLQEQMKNMHIIDDELYFVIDEQHNSVDLTDKGIDLLTASYNEPEFFILPDVGGEIADLQKLELSEDELIERKADMIRNYSVKSERLHTVNQLLKAYTLFEKDDEYVIIDNKVKIVDEQTGRIMEGRRYSDGLHQAIEAKENVKIEAATQTYATITLQNYFRMYNKLAGMTGTAETEAGELWDIYKLDVVVIPTNKPITRDDRQDLVYKTKREKFNAVIDEIESLVKARRPVLVGTTSVETSELLARMLQRKSIAHNVLNAKLHAKEAQIVKEAGQPGTVTIATNMAGRGTDIKLGKGVKEAGGLAIIGTERHESRRVDRQLRGRAGRQGDPGSSQFFVSLEDDLMRMFGSGRIAGLMDRLGLKEGEVIQHSMITKSIERAQRKVEENNFGIRKRLLEYDDVMNAQREVIYKKRKHALFGERLSVDISNMMYDLAENLVAENQDARDYEALRMALISNLGIEPPFDSDTFFAAKTETLADEIFAKAFARYRDKNKRIGEKTMPVIQDVFEKQTQYENIAIPITDGSKGMQVVVNLKKAVEHGPREVSLSIEKSISLALIDDSWKEHLRELDDLKQSVQNATYEQKDPLLIYKFESFELFKSMIQKINREVISFLMRADIPVQSADNVKEARQPRGLDRSKMKEERSDLLSQAHSNTQAQQVTQPIVAEKKVGRNEPCPCGSGKKYKNCHGKVSANV
ncbi:MAG: preprotein translocase subunit SecA [Bacteroidetes bacterium]|nr:preprotein translocase subunit SecA [Bacteroidota bacterium]MBU1580813.1 preprotein translocase subunit SecA [Bacteroidota bacterium]MBU2466508.1 preprotein translocase subunit SecA [Bacteroidota bacterium]MBU2558989.1 preprotein translocase subunit SecA [Bacteroidota bacterium]